MYITYVHAIKITALGQFGRLVGSASRGRDSTNKTVARRASNVSDRLLPLRWHFHFREIATSRVHRTRLMVAMRSISTVNIFLSFLPYIFSHGLLYIFFC